MEPITIGLIIINLILGALIGFITVLIDDPRFIGGIQVLGFFIFAIEIFALLPSFSLQTHVEMSAVSDSMANIIYALLSYLIGDVAFGFGARIFLGK